MKNELKTKALVYLSRHNPLADHDVDQGVYARWLIEFSTVHGEGAVISLAGFHMWCMKNIKNAKDRKIVLANTFFHDLVNGRKSALTTMRSRGYAAHFNSLSPFLA